MKRLFVCVALCIGVFGCAKDVELAPASDDVKLSKSYLISSDSIRRIATKLPALFGGPTTRASLTSKVATITPLNRLAKNTKSGNNDLAQIDYIYVVDYEDQGGFALISADSRMDQVLAYSDKCSFDATSGIPGIEGLISNIPDYAQLQLAEWDSLIDPNPPGYEYYVDRSEVINTESVSKGPFITTAWGQWAPFNKYLNPIGPLYGGTISMLQIMAYYNWPSYIIDPNNTRVTLNWTEDRRYIFGPILEMYPESVYRIAKAAQNIHDIIGDLGGAHEIQLGALTMGYLVDRYNAYNLESLKADLSQNRPVILDGYSKTTILGGETDGNTWIVDGYKDIFITYQYYRVWYNGLGEELRRENLGTSTSSQQLLHCNWGWDGRGDGYFTAGLFAPQKANSYDWPTLTTTDDHNYRFAMKQTINLRPEL